MSIYLGLTLSHESSDLIKIWWRHIAQHYLNDLSQIVILRNTNSEAWRVIPYNNIRVIDISPDTPIFIRHQMLVDEFLTTQASFFIKMDFDTIVLNRPTSWHRIEGQWLRYTSAHQKARWPYMPENWRRKNKFFQNKNYIDSIHGGYMLYNREVASLLSQFFWREPTTWTHLQAGNIRENHESQTMLGEEHTIGWYFNQAQISITKEPGVDKIASRYLTYRGVLSKAHKDLLVYHPIKTLDDYQALLSSL